MSSHDPATDIYAAAFDAAPSAIVVFDDDGRYTHANAEASHIMGASVTQIVGRKLGEFTAERNLHSIDRFWEELKTDGESRGVHRVHGLSGEERVIRYRARGDFAPGLNILVSEELAAGGQRLSPREAEILSLLARGLNGTRVAEELTISPQTVRTHIRNAMYKLEARTRVHAIALASARGEIRLTD